MDREGQRRLVDGQTENRKPSKELEKRERIDGWRKTNWNSLQTQSQCRFDKCPSQVTSTLFAIHKMSQRVERDSSLSHVPCKECNLLRPYPNFPRSTAAHRPGSSR
eukprot:TRINITY_DN9408_c0_g1_i2.p1 TRINITY_DN9408_c0_g1~~TRINITY_DN9408_c0_g1_i2.p1  ORF type:complete len:106 (+),score=6.50 TRINITY_DN9408_c0_g1_i2:275-592(+)